MRDRDNNLLPGTILKENYKVIDIIYKGLLGGIYKGLNIKKNKFIFIKELITTHKDRSLRQQAIEQFKFEAKIFFKIKHENLPKFEDYFDYKENRYLIFEYIEGETLDNFIKNQTRLLSEKKIISLGIQLCTVISYLHNFTPGPIIFRNLNPGNIISGKEDILKLIDFGMSKLYSTKERTMEIAKAITVPHYSSLEQHIGTTDERSDIYSLGATMYYIITGRSPKDSLERSMEEEPLIPCSNFNPGISNDLNKIIIKAMELDPEDRYRNIEEMKADFLNILPEDMPDKEIIEAPSAGEDTKKEVQKAISGKKQVTIKTKELVKKETPDKEEENLSRKISKVKDKLEKFKIKTGRKDKKKVSEPVYEEEKGFIEQIITEEEKVEIIENISTEIENDDCVIKVFSEEEINKIVTQIVKELEEDFIDESVKEDSQREIERDTETREEELQEEMEEDFIDERTEEELQEEIEEDFIDETAEEELQEEREEVRPEKIEDTDFIKKTSDKIGNYELISLISSSHSSLVYKGLDKKNNRELIFKELLFDTVLSEKEKQELADRFQSYTEVLINLEHLNLPKILDYFEFYGNCYLVMEFINGKGLDKILSETSESIREKELFSWATKVCDVLNYLHSRKPAPIIYTNLSPDNIFLDINGEIKLLGFGLSKISTPNTKNLHIQQNVNLYYSPPEQYSGITDITGDIYSLGATLYYLATKVHPVDSLERNLEDLPEISIYNKSISPEFASIIYKALSLKKSDRYQSIEEVKKAIENLESSYYKTISTEVTLEEGVRDVRPQAIEVKEEDKKPAIYDLIKERYKIINLIKKDSLNNLYTGFDLKKNNIICIKEVFANIRREEAVVLKEHLHSRVNLLGDLSHPNLSGLEDCFIYENKLYIITEYIEGQSLQSIIENIGIPSWSKAVEWTIQICYCLNYLHNMNPPLIFKSLSPANIFLKKTGIIKLAELDMALVMEPSEKRFSEFNLTGKYFLAPEVYFGKTDARVDIYSLGATVYYLLTGIFPAEASERMLSYAPLNSCKEINKDLPPELEEVVMKCMELDRNKRFQTVLDIQRNLWGLYPSIKEKIKTLYR